MALTYQPQQTIKLAIDCETGELLSSDMLLDLDEEVFRVLRREAMAARGQRRKGNDNEVRFRCAICKQPVFLTCHKGGHKNRWFKHDGASSDCPWFEGNSLSPELIKALIYRGQQEGAEHRRTKQFIANWLQSDPEVSNVNQEQTTFSEVAKGEWRRPDVKCLYRGVQLVFEIQLSYTFLSDVIARDEFYKREGIFIIWIFGKFELNRAAVADEVFFNRRNLFVLDGTAKTQTIEHKALTFSGFHQVPQLTRYGVEDSWKWRDIRLNDVFFPQDKSRPYFFDYDAELKNLKASRLAELEEQQKSSWNQGIQDYIQAAIAYHEGNCPADLRHALIQTIDQLKENLNWRDFYKSLSDSIFYGHHGVLAVLLSIRFGKPIGYDGESVYRVIEAGLRSSYGSKDKHPFAVIYLIAFRIYKPVVSDKHRIWLVQYANEVKRSVENRELTYRRYADYDEVISLLFPELYDPLLSQFSLEAIFDTKMTTQNEY